MYFEWPRSLSETDQKQILAILNMVAMREGTNGIPHPLSDEEGAAFTAALDGALRRGECYQLLGRDDSDHHIVSFATLERIKMNPARAHVIEVKRMASTPEVRGFGGYLLAGWRHILDKCAELGCDLITIDVSEDGPYRLWQKLGFHIYASMEDYARVGDRKLSGHFLALNLEDAYKKLDRMQHYQTQLRTGDQEPGTQSSVEEETGRRSVPV